MRSSSAKRFTELVSDTERQQRTMLGLSLELPDADRAALPLRQGRATGWIEEALALMRWSARSLLHAWLTDGPPPSGRQRRKRVPGSRRAGHSGSFSPEPPTT